MDYTQAKTWLIASATKAHKFEFLNVQNPADGKISQQVSACCCYVVRDGNVTRDIDLNKGCNCGATLHNLQLTLALRVIAARDLVVNKSPASNTPVAVEKIAPKFKKPSNGFKPKSAVQDAEAVVAALEEEEKI
jgi:hypothetical protein